MKMIFRIFGLAVLFVYFLFSCKPNSVGEEKKIAVDSSESKLDTAVVGEVVSMWWHTAKFDSAFAYMYNGLSLGDNIVIRGRLNPKVKTQTKCRLRADQIREICSILSGTNRDVGDATAMADCFYPAQGFVFYSGGVIQGHLSVCYSCDGNAAVPEGYDFNNERLAHIFESFGLPVIRDPIESYNYFEIYANILYDGCVYLHNDCERGFIGRVNNNDLLRKWWEGEER